ncbi:hypothetical protein Q5P01_000555 [Channa striata]|uniref:Uncharacterized protein n=1 Tax=Channa striata TaxID=64152 RepID=A0AA88IJ13_CHASR|nr:hypothetical protein Q5P01_000555 [Channa striata]
MAFTLSCYSGVCQVIDMRDSILVEQCLYVLRVCELYFLFLHVHTLVKVAVAFQPINTCADDAATNRKSRWDHVTSASTAESAEEDTAARPPPCDCGDAPVSDSGERQPRDQIT